MVKITLDSKYKVKHPSSPYLDLQGPLLIRGYLRKVKHSGSMSRLFGLYNTRYLTLDLNQLIFYYGKNENTNFKNVKLIRLQARISSRLTNLPEHK